MSDAELLSRWRAGDAAAGSALFERHFRALYRFFRTKVNSGIEDLVQDTMLACVQGRDRLVNDDAFRGYLYTIARRKLIARYNTGRSAIDASEVSIADASPGPASVFAKKREDRRILEALRALPIDYQIALELFEFETMSATEVARILEVPEGTVRSRVRRARLQMRQTLEKLAADPSELESTTTRLADWAADVHRKVTGPP